ncbi:MAG: GNAT family protein [Patescibacteria group bacterium]|nr:GNAT family protein [Patescibacteria group bacterium]
MPKPTLKGPRITLRQPKLSDAALCVRWFNDPKVTIYLGRQQKLAMKDEIEYLKKMIRDKDNYNYSVINENGKHIGMAGFHLKRKDKRATYGITIGEKKEWGKGYGQEITEIIIDFVFRKLKVNRLDLKVFEPNKRAVHIYEKMGFKIEGHRRAISYNLVTKRFDDDYIMSILREDWLKRKGRRILTKKRV